LSDGIAIVAALGASVVFGMSSVAEQRGTKKVRPRKALSPWILVDLVRTPVWDASIGGTLLGFVLQVVALKYGPLALVEPILVCDLVFAVLINAYLRHRWDPVMLAGVFATAAGVAGFLAISRPSGGHSTVSVGVVLPLAAGLAALVAGSLTIARQNDNIRPLGVALACGVCYGASAFLVKLVTGGGLTHLFTTWPIYALAVVAPVGFVLNQDAFQQGKFLPPVLSIITACDPLVSIALGFLWLGESLNSKPLGIAGEIIALAVMVGGIVVMAHHSPQVLRKLQEAEQQGDDKPAQAA
jgi:drug/metabolite transporter (DMT)-like permease